MREILGMFSKHNVKLIRSEDALNRVNQLVRIKRLGGGGDWESGSHCADTHTTDSKERKYSP